MKKPKKSEVRVIWSKRPVTLVEKGAQVSLIRWDETKMEQAIPNDQLEFLDQVTG